MLLRGTAASLLTTTTATTSGENQVIGAQFWTSSFKLSSVINGNKMVVVSAVRETNVKPLIGVFSEQLVELKNELETVPIVAQVSFGKKYADEREVATNEKTEFIKEAYLEERKNTDKFMNHQCEHGGWMELQSLVMPLSKFSKPQKGDLLQEICSNVWNEGRESSRTTFGWIASLSCGALPWLITTQMAYAGTSMKIDAVYEIGAFFELGIQLSYLLLLLALLGVGSFFVIRQVLLRRELDLSAKELQEQVRSGDANAIELFELGAVMLRRKFYPAAIKYLLQAIEKWDGEDQDLAQVYNALGVSFVREGKLDKGIAQFETAVKLQPGYVTCWNNLGDAYEEKKEYKAALRAFEEVLLFDPNNRVARPRVDSLRERVKLYQGVPMKSKDR